MNFTCRHTRILCLCVVLLHASTSKVTGQDSAATPSAPGQEAASMKSALKTAVDVTGDATGSGGTPARIFRSSATSSYPYTVSLRRRSDLGYFCAGVLVGNRHVLTAAHCVDSSTTSTDSRPQVVVGSAYLSKTSGNGIQVISTQNVFLHPNYKSNRSPDLAILELSSAANQAPVRIPTSTSFRPQNGNLLRSIGWGRTRRDSGFSDIAQVVQVDFIDTRRCRRILRKPAPKHQICMGGDGGGSCQGDDGGPIVLPGKSRANDVLVGIVGSSHECGGSRPDVHTNIVPFSDWIKSTAGLP
ncbi:hypothetical protein BSKO_13407 [Bryopsis sp. KO-2023]|nr:hypothetical protein BSKO_13407 [Bryopsis sp. KO-2023]